MYELGVACQRVKACTSIPVEYSGFQVTGMIEESFTFEIFNSGSFLGRKIWQVFFLDGLSMDSLAIQNNLKIPGSAAYSSCVVL